MVRRRLPIGMQTFRMQTFRELREREKRQVNSLALGEMLGSSDLLSTFDVDDVATEALLY